MSSVTTNDATPPAAAKILSLRQISNRILVLKLAAPDTDADQSPLTGFTFARVFVDTKPLNGNDYAADSLQAGINSFDVTAAEFEPGGVAEVQLPILMLGQPHHVAVYCTDGVDEGSVPVPPDPTPAETSPPPASTGQSIDNSSVSTEPESTSSPDAPSASGPEVTSESAPPAGVLAQRPSIFDVVSRAG